VKKIKTHVPPPSKVKIKKTKSEKKMPPIPLQELEKITKKIQIIAKSTKVINKTQAPLPLQIKVDCPPPKTQPNLEKEIKNLSPPPLPLARPFFPIRLDSTLSR